MLSLSFLTMYLAVLFIGVVVGQDFANDLARQRNDYCAEGNLCLTSFRWCNSTSLDTGNGTVTTSYCNLSPIANDIDFLVSSISQVSIYYGSLYNVTWINADPEYPVLVDWYFGPSQGVVNTTAPAWSQNVTQPFLQINPFQILYELGDNDGDANISYTGYALGWSHSFTISQPERPATAGINTTDESDIFRMADTTVQSAVRRIRDNNEESLADERRRWRLGVGVGVGLGVPLLLLAAFIAGRVMGKKSVTKVRTKQPIGEQKGSDLSDGDRPITG